MADITVFEFESNEVRYVGDGSNHEWVATDICVAMGLSNPSQALASLEDDEKGITNVYTNRGPREVLTVNEFGLYSLMFKGRKPQAKRFKRWVTREVLPSIRKTGAYSVAEPEPESSAVTIGTIEETYSLLSKVFGPAYAESAVILNMRRHHPDVALPEVPATERSSLKSADALLTPTQLAAELGLNYKSGSPSPRAANKLLEEMGPQKKVSGQWQPTEAGKLYSDRKPIDTGSRSDKTQLLWFSSVLEILQGSIAA